LDDSDKNLFVFTAMNNMGKMNKKFAEDCLIVTSIILTIISLLFNALEAVDFFVDWFIISLFFYFKIPSRLNSYFQTTMFRKDLPIRLGIVLFPALMFWLFLLSVPLGFFLLPIGFEHLNVLDLSVSVLALIGVVFLSIVYFSWRIWNCSDAKLATRLWRKVSESDEEFECDIALSNRSRIDNFFNKLVSPGVVPMAVSVILFFATYVLMIIDVLLAILLVGWLAYNILYEIRQRSSSFRDRSGFAYALFKKLDEILAWESLLQLGLAGRMGGIIEVIIMMGCFSILILVSVLNLAAFVVVFGFLCQWYVLIILIQIARRTTYRKQASKSKKLPPKLPRFSNIILPSCLTMLVGFSVAGYLNLQESQDFVRIFTVLSLILSVGAIVSITNWVKRKNLIQSESVEPLEKDRYRLYAIFYALGLMIALIGRSMQGIVFWTALSGALILLAMQDVIRKRVQSSGPKTYATATTLHLAVGIYTILGTAIYFYPELSTLMTVVATLSGFLLLLMWLQLFRLRSLPHVE
jgi:hypothetical protein